MSSPAKSPPSFAGVRDSTRLEAVRSTGLLDSGPEESFDRLTRLAVRLVGVPVAFVSLVDEFRDFYKSHCGFGEPLSTVRQLEGTTFCHYAIASDGPLVIPDTRADPEYRKVPTVESLGIAAYAGIPIRNAEGVALGSFCAVDFTPREWTQSDIEVLSELALSAEREIQLRTALAAAEAAGEEAMALNEQLQLQAVELEEHVENRQVLLQIARSAQDEAEKADRAKSQFLANMSHELRTPINAIVGYTDLLSAGIGGPLTEQQQGYVDRVRGSGAHLIELVSEILDLAKVESGNLEVEVAALKPGPMVDAALSMVLPQATAKQLLVVEEESCHGDFFLLGDESRVRQILVNLLSNAVKFSAPGATITLSCGLEAGRAGELPGEGGDWVRIDIEDTGIGIAPEHLEDVFEPFRQVDDQHTRKEGGTGLGLTISRKLARLMGGELTLRSAPGKGSCFTLWLRAAAPEDRRSD